MQPIICGLASLAVANIYYWYRSYQQQQTVRARKLCERVAYMLWAAADQVP
jgi:hypothetical protein